MKKLVLFGAGKIGRSFIGQLFSVAGFEVVFIDVCEEVINELNRRRSYDVIIKSNLPEEIIHIENVRGILANNEEKIIKELIDCDIAAVSVGQNGLPNVITLFAKGILARLYERGNMPLDFILAENMRDAANYVKTSLVDILGADFPINEMVGLVETSIGKMVPIMPKTIQEKDILLVYAEPYNSLILDKKAFKNPIPNVNGLSPKVNMKAWVDRKSYIHNFGHAAAAYIGYQANPNFKFVYEVLENPEIKRKVRNAMLLSAEILQCKYPGEFTTMQLTEHIDDLLFRFSNRQLGDTIYRVGCDLKRKLHGNDRILSPLEDGIKYEKDIRPFVEIFKMGLKFQAKDESGKLFPGDMLFHQSLREKGIYMVLTELCGISNSKTLELFLEKEFVYSQN